MIVPWRVRNDNIWVRILFYVCCMAVRTENYTSTGRGEGVSNKCKLFNITNKHLFMASIWSQLPVPTLVTSKLNHQNIRLVLEVMILILIFILITFLYCLSCSHFSYIGLCNKINNSSLLSVGPGVILTIVNADFGFLSLLSTLVAFHSLEWYWGSWIFMGPHILASLEGILKKNDSKKD